MILVALEQRDGDGEDDDDDDQKDDDDDDDDTRAPTTKRITNNRNNRKTIKSSSNYNQQNRTTTRADNEQDIKALAVTMANCTAKNFCGLQVLRLGLNAGGALLA